MTNQEIVNDFRRRYEQTYCWLYMDKLKEEALVHIDRVADDDDKVATLTVSSNKFGQLALNLGSADHELRFKYPPVGVFQSGNDAFMYRRRPQRQYRRGICPDNSVLSNVTRNLVGNRARFNAQEIQAAFDHKTYSEKQAMTLLQGGFKGCALNNNFAITQPLEESNPDYILWHWGYPVARINTKGKLTQILEKQYTNYLAEGFYK